MTAALDFSAHVAEVLLAASRITNTIMRCFVIRDPSFYIKLYQALVVPRLSYCCEIWRPYLKKDKLALDRTQRRFLRRVAYRCGIDVASISLRDLDVIYDTADRNMLNRLRGLPCFDVLFREFDTNLRRGRVTQPRVQARNDRVLNMFAWRVCRLLSNESLSK